MLEKGQKRNIHQKCQYTVGSEKTVFYIVKSDKFHELPGVGVPSPPPHPLSVISRTLQNGQATPLMFYVAVYITLKTQFLITKNP